MTNVKVEHGWAERLMGYYKEGYSDTEVAASLNMTKREFNQMLTENATFAKLVEFGRTLSAAHWEALARTNVKNKQFNTPLYKLYMANKFGWSEKVETSNINENNNLSADELKSKIAKQLKKLKDQNGVEAIDAQFVLEPIENQDDEDESV